MQPAQSAVRPFLIGTSSSNPAAGSEQDPDDISLDEADYDDDNRDIYVTVDLPGMQRPLIDKIHRLLFTQCNDLRRTADGRYVLRKTRSNSDRDGAVTTINRNRRPIDAAAVSVSGPSTSTTGFRSKLNGAVKIVQNAVQSGNRFHRLVDGASTTSTASK